jgi:hypothetical protein
VVFGFDIIINVLLNKITAHDGLRSLINLSSDPLVQQELDDADFLKYIGLLITVSYKSVCEIGKVY